ncbi:MAG: aminoacetone oxidase family FAD-binding enzyme, partial [Actinobacteria bacterium]|nr:aminoacetone oxidase family FAD-binding enzyme [Actinomycetota bacterium]
MSRKVAIIGGGASGLAAAITAAQRGASVTILEAQDRIGKKILVTGNGRCNFSNAAVSPGAYNDPEFVTPLIDAYPSSEICSFFERLGLLSYSDDEGRIYPSTNTANSVLDVLRLECGHLGVEERCGFDVVDVRRGDGFADVAQSGETVHADAVILASGGGTELWRALGHPFEKSVPVLCPIKTSTGFLAGLSGVRVRCSATLYAGDEAIASENGELLFRDYGVSGIMIFDLSRFARKGQTLSLDFFPASREDDLKTLLAERMEWFAWRERKDFFAGMLHPRVATALLKRSDFEVPALARTLKDFRLDVLGCGDAKQAQVMRGGATTSAFSSTTLESSRIRG